MKEKYRNCYIFAPIVIKDNVHVGTSVIIMHRVAIGSNCIIGSGAVVTHDIPDNSVALGVPAKVIKTIEEYEEKTLPIAFILKDVN